MSLRYFISMYCVDSVPAIGLIGCAYADFLSAYYGRARSANLLQQSKEAELLCLQCWLLREISDAPGGPTLAGLVSGNFNNNSILVFCRQLSSRRLCFYALLISKYKLSKS